MVASVVAFVPGERGRVDPCAPLTSAYVTYAASGCYPVVMDTSSSLPWYQSDPG
jgi:hypothetical protein